MTMMQRIVVPAERQVTVASLWLRGPADGPLRRLNTPRGAKGAMEAVVPRILLPPETPGGRGRVAGAAGPRQA